MRAIDMNAMYEPSDILGEHRAAITGADLIQLLDHWRTEETGSVPTKMRVLNDGRVVNADHDFSSDPNPTVYARENLSKFAHHSTLTGRGLRRTSPPPELCDQLRAHAALAGAKNPP